jgi:hypothetical protein
MQASEPGDVEKTKLTEKLETCLWDRWEIEGHDLTLEQVIKNLEDKYEGLQVKDVLRGNAPIYFHAIMNAPGKETEKEKTLKAKIKELIGAMADDENYVDLTMTCSLKEDKEDKILEGVPPIRVYLTDQKAKQAL